MTRKDYIIIANALKQARLQATEQERDGIDMAMTKLMYGLRRDNARFDAARFRKWIQGDDAK